MASPVLNISFNPVFTEGAFAAATAKMKAALGGIVDNSTTAGIKSVATEFDNASTSAQKVSKGIAESATEAKKLDAAMGGAEKSIDKAATSSTGLLGGLKKSFAEGQAQASSGGGLFGSLASGVGQLASPIGLATAALGTFTAAAASAFTEYRALDKNIQNIGTLGVEASGLSLTRFESLITDLSKRVPDSASNIANGVYNAISAGITGSEKTIVGFAEIASKVAVAGLSDTNSAVNALTSVVNAYGTGAAGAKSTSDVFFATIKAGKTTFTELNAGLANVIPSASAAGISFEEVGASIAKLTTVGIPTAQATTQLRAAIIELQKPAKPLADALAKIGLDASNMGAQLKKPAAQGGGLINTLQKLQESAAKSGQSLVQIFGSAEAASAALSLTGKNAESATAIFKGLQTDVAGGVATKAYEAAAKGIDVQIGIIKNQVQAAFNEMFAAIKPVVTEIFGVLVDTFSTVKEALAPAFAAVASALAPVVTVVGTVFGGVALLAVKTITGVVVQFANGLRIIAPALGFVAVALGAYAIVSNAAAIGTALATAAQWAYNAAMYANPIGLIIAGALAAVVAIGALTDALSVSTQEQLENAESQKKAVEIQIKDNSEKKKGVANTQALVTEFEALSKKSKLTADEQKRMRDIQGELDKQYPKLIDQTKSFADNLQGVHDIGKIAAESMAGLTKQGSELQKQLAESVRVIAGAKRNVAIDELRDVLGDFHLFSIAGDKFRREFSSVRGEFEKGLFSAKTTEEIDNASNKILEYVNNNKDLIKSDELVALYGGISKAVTASKDALAAYKGEVIEVAKAENAPAPPPPPDPKIKEKKTKELKDLTEEIKKAKLENSKIISDMDVKLETDEATRLRKANEEKTKNNVAQVRDEIDKVTKEKNVSAVQRAELIRELARKETLLTEQGYSERFGIEQKLEKAALDEKKQIADEARKQEILAQKETINETQELLASARDAEQKAILTSRLGEEKVKLIQLETDAEKAALVTKNKQLSDAQKILIDARAAQDVANLRAASEAVKNEITTALDGITLGAGSGVGLSDITSQLVAEADAQVAAATKAYEDLQAQLLSTDTAVVAAAKKAAREQLKVLEEASAARDKIILGDSLVYQSALAFQLNLEKAFSDDAIAERKRISKESDAQLKVQEDALFTSLKNRTLDEKGYYSQVAEIEKARAKAQTDSVNLFKVASTAVVDTLKTSASGAQETATASAKRLKQLYATQAKDEAGSTALLKEQAEAKSQLYGDLAVSAGTSFASLLASGQNAADSMLAILIQTAVTFLNAMIPTWIAGIFGTTVAQLGPLGLGIAAVATGTLTALAGVAKSALVGADGGVVGIDENYSMKPSKRDVFPVMTRAGESHINSEATAVNRPLLEFINRTNRPAHEFYANMGYDSPEVKQVAQKHIARANGLERDLTIMRQNYDALKQSAVAVSVHTSSNANMDGVIIALQQQTQVLVSENKTLRAQLRNADRANKVHTAVVPRIEQKIVVKSTNNNW